MPDFPRKIAQFLLDRGFESDTSQDKVVYVHDQGHKVIPPRGADQPATVILPNGKEWEVYPQDGDWSQLRTVISKTNVGAVVSEMRVVEDLLPGSELSEGRDPWYQEHPGYSFEVLSMGKILFTTNELPRARTFARTHYRQTGKRVEVRDAISRDVYWRLG